ncbi:MAG TPA: acyl-CoA dehydrogenase family protein [Rubrivivax sp.]|nr:acyl-CoA dehydrogenase family protein [Rubrivivax sp.]
MKTSFEPFGLNEHQRMIRESVLDLLADVLPRQRIKALDAAGEFPHEAYQALGAAGWMGLPFPEEHGGSGGSNKDLAVLAEALGQHYGGVAVAYLTSVVYAGMHLLHSGSAHIKRSYIPRLARGEIKLSIAMSEPKGGSDVASIGTRAVRDGGAYVIDGSKIYITNAHVADYLVVVAKTKPDAGHRGVSMFLVDARAPGITVRPLEMLGRRTTHANEVFFDAVRVPADHLLGEENAAWRGLMKGLNMERMCIAASGAGNTQAIVDYTVDYATQRLQFGQPISRFQVIQHRIVDMRILAETARLMSYRVADMLDAGLDPVLETSMAKIVATDNNFACANMGMQILGGAGYTMEYDMQMYFRDSRVGPIGAGTNEIQRNIIAKRMGL